MPKITLPDGSVKEFAKPVTAYEVAMSIGPKLAEQSMGARIDGELRDIGTPIEKDATLSLITSRPRDDQQRADLLFLMRHSAAHVMAEAIQRIVPGAQLVYGPPLETGFYYDIRFPDERPLTAGDFEKIEAEMASIIAEDRPFTRYGMGADKGMAKLKTEGSKYKLDNAQRAMDAGSAELTWYATGQPGENWEDLCRGPHVPSTGKIGAVKVMSLASSYWHGDENSDRLTRVYGTAFPSQKELDEYLNALEEAKQRDHRVVGKKMRLFHIDEMVGQGLILWTPNGSIVRGELQKFISEELTKQGYRQVVTPHIGKLDLFRTSGHFPYYKESQYPPIPERDALEAMASEGCSCAEMSNRLESGEAEGYLLKPMNCPFHIRIFDSAPHSYRDLPVRLAEFGTVYRWEQSGELNGMTRVRGFTQDDAHLFCTEEQVGGELHGCLELVKIVLNTLGITDYRVRVGLRDPDSSKYVGDPDNWNKAEAACRDAAKSLGVKFSEEPGEAAFYGPKIDFVVKDVIGREWQLGTVQVDYNMPIRFNLSYTGADNKAHTPVMIHRAPFGSMERFCGVLIEHFAGAFPLWLSPEQVRVLPISEKSNEYAEKVHGALKAAGLRSSIDFGNERVQAKIRNAAEEKVPVMAVVGPRDAENGTVSVRIRGVQNDLGQMALDAFVSALAEEYRSRGATMLSEKFGK
ncbi:MAG: threonine--tRNA ligase [Phycisphaerales bacterium]|nr:threonine--tRNA ligase [Phycisphaerales bacterium]